MSHSPLSGIELVVLDLDGTLLPSSKELTPESRRVIGEVRAAGIEVTLATGKGWTLTRGYAQRLGLEVPIVALEGALVGHPTRAQATPGEMLRHLTHDALTLRRVRRALEDLAVGWFFTRDGRHILAQQRLEVIVHLLRVWDPAVEFVQAPLDDPDHGRAHVLHVVGEQEPVAEAHRRLRELRMPGVQLLHARFWDGLWQIMLMPADVGKQHGLQCLLDHLELPAANVLACGDWLNDLDMLRMAGVSVAPGNAVPDVRAAADHVLPHTCEEDAIPRFLDAALRAL